MAKRILRPKEIYHRLGVGKTKFWQDFVATGRLKLFRLGPRSVGATEDQVDALIDEMIAERDRAAGAEEKTRASLTQNPNAASGGVLPSRSAKELSRAQSDRCNG